MTNKGRGETLILIPYLSAHYACYAFQVAEDAGRLLARIVGEVGAVPDHDVLILGRFSIDPRIDSGFEWRADGCGPSGNFLGVPV